MVYYKSFFTYFGWSEPNRNHLKINFSHTAVIDNTRYDKRSDREQKPRSKSSHYTWFENHIIPPKGVPLLSSSHLWSYFQGRKTLLLRDNTGRRAYDTPFGIMNNTYLTHIHVQDTDRKVVIDVNKPINRKDIIGIQECGLFNKISMCNYLLEIWLNQKYLQKYRTQKKCTTYSDVVKGNNVHMKTKT